MENTENKNLGESTVNKRNDIIKAAYEIFYKDGFHNSGVDKILADTGISKRTLYKYFRSKEELIIAVVEYYQQILFEKIPQILSQKSKDPKKQILALFDIKKEEFKNGDFSGCFAINAKLEFESKNSLIENSCQSFYLMLEEYVKDLCKKAKLKNPRRLARKIMILFDGAMVLGQMHHDHSTMKEAREMASSLINLSSTN